MILSRRPGQNKINYRHLIFFSLTSSMYYTYVYIRYAMYQIGHYG